MNNAAKIYQDELECLTGKVYTGDITPLVFELLKDSPYKTALLKEITGEEYISENTTPKVIEPDAAPSFDDWFDKCVPIRQET